MQLLSVSKYGLPPNEAYATGARLLRVEVTTLLIIWFLTAPIHRRGRGEEANPPLRCDVPSSAAGSSSMDMALFIGSSGNAITV